MRNVLGLAERNPLCLDERGQFAHRLATLRSTSSSRSGHGGRLRRHATACRKIKRAFDEAGIDIPFPHRTLQLGGDGRPLPVRVIDADG